MEIDLLSLSLNELQALQQKADRELKQALLDGAAWNEVRDKRITVTKLTQALYRKREATVNSTPADSQLRTG